ncbi:MAG: SH3 domain-containing protein, partial [Anaerolineales bacterium]|nr:SH3 domain-containing protein [Anaerolineales bacterium]
PTSTPPPTLTIQPSPSETPSATPPQTATATPPEGNQTSQCPGAPHSSLGLDTWARANTETASPNLVRSHPDLGAEVVGKIQPGELVKVTGTFTSR